MRKSWLFFSLFILYLPARPALGQVSFTAWQPTYDSFPIVRIPVSVSDNGQPAQTLDSANFTVLEDGVSQTPLQLWGCAGSPAAAVAFVVDTSSSMDNSVGSGPQTNRNYQKFFNGFSGFIASIPAPSQLALIEFARTATGWPGAPRWFYNSNSANDMAEFMIDLEAGLPPSLFSGTNVDSGITLGVSTLLQSTIPRRVMILVTDDSPDQADSIRRYLLANGITLYFMDVNPGDSNTINFAGKDLAEATGGAYFQAYDTNHYSSTLLAISQLIFGEHCTLRYVSSAPCPWRKSHQIQVDLNYNGVQPPVRFSFNLAAPTNDKHPPTWTVDSTIFTKRILTTYDRLPCESGMYTLLDGTFKNFRHPRLPVLTADSATDSLIVIDSLEPADGDFIATDSAGNQSHIHVHYDPKPDQLPPLIDPAQWAGGGVITMRVTEQRAWDRGIKSVSLQPGATNLVLDSVHYYYSNRYAFAYLRMPKPTDSSGGCLFAVDSFTNSSTQCYSYGENGDMLPPLFVQDPIAIPRGMLTGAVTELRLGDRGIQRVQLTPLINTQNPIVTPSSARQSSVQVTMLDTLYRARTLVEAWDSAGNHMWDTMRYEPLPDTLPPQLSYTVAGSIHYTFSATEIRPWDRGLMSLALLAGPSRNVTASVPVFTDKAHGTITIDVTDPTQIATIFVQATDSAGHTASTRVEYDPPSILPLQPLGDSVIDFGNVVLPGGLQRQVVMTNPNDVPVTLALGPLTGDDSVFSIITASPVTIAPHAQQALTFTYHPVWLGSWKAVASIQNDTMHLGSVTLIGTSSGTFSLSLDTVFVPHVGGSGTLVLSIDAAPKPINLDTVLFTVTYDADFVTLQDFVNCPTGALDTGICLYDAQWTGGTDGNRTATIARRSKAVATTLSFDKTQISIPFVTVVAPHDSTPVHFASASASYSALVKASDGFISSGDTCGTGMMRATMNGALELRIESTRPNPASSSFDITLHSATETEASINLISVLGCVEKTIPVHLTAGDQTVRITDLPVSSGVFELILKAPGASPTRQRIEILR